MEGAAIAPAATPARVTSKRRRVSRINTSEIPEQGGTQYYILPAEKAQDATFRFFDEPNMRPLPALRFPSVCELTYFPQP